ncbi:protease HtpX [uncultured Sutterella sp.]|uniref:protease HtpX n=1 Tax=uncultured Sutterella sp. TaxID=286133 RepID=UPI0025E0F042|nr:protease HtpX [uncultured Sutterella sp.]
MFKRIGLLILANFAIFIMLSVILNVISMVTGINFGTMSGKSLNLGALFVFAMVVGFSGSIISLLMSKTMAKMSMGLTMVDVDHPRNAVESYLVSVIRSESEKAGIPMPEVAIYDGEPNAFATGPSKSSSLVAVSTGLLNLMNRDEVEAVLAHEISHVKNGDMVTMTLLQGVMNTFVVFASRVIGWVVDRQILRNEDDAPGVGYYVTSLVLDICLGFLASMVVAAFSRYREYHADAGAANIMGTTTPMINALARLGGVAPNELPGSVKGFGISGGIGSLFASHPSIEDRIKALREHRYTAN